MSLTRCKVANMKKKLLGASSHLKCMNKSHSNQNKSQNMRDIYRVAIKVGLGLDVVLKRSEESGDGGTKEKALKKEEL